MNPQNTPISGIFNILATPFDAQERLDLPSLSRLVEFQLALGVHGLTILGVLGEAGKLSIDERQQVLETVIDTVQQRVPVIVGTSHAHFDTCVHLTRAAVDAGASGVMVAPPPMPDYTDDDVFKLYADLAAQVETAIIVQDFPPVNGVIMSPALLARIAEQLPAARYLKLEDPPLMEKISAITAQTDRFAIFGGLGGMFLLEELQRGATGTMTGFAFSEILVAVYQAFIAGDHAQAARIFDRYLPLIRYENQPVINLAIRKALLHRRGAIDHPTPRSPYHGITAATEREIDAVLARVGIQDPTQKLTL